MQLAVQQPDLSQMFGQDSLYSTLYGLQRQQQATDAQNQNMSQAQQDQSFQAQDQPYNLQQLAANTAHTQAMTDQANAQTPGLAADSTMRQNAADVDSSIPTDTKRAAALAKIAANMSTDDANAHEAQARSDLFSPDPVKRQNAQMVLDNLPDVRAKIREIQAQGANEAGVASINQAGATQREQMSEDAGKYNKNSLDYLLLKGKTSGNFQAQAGALNAMADQSLAAARATQDPSEQQFHLTQAQQYKQQAQEAVLNDYRAKQAAGTAANAGKLDVSQAAGIPTVVDAKSLPQPPQMPITAAPVQDTPPPTSSSVVTVYKADGTPVQINSAGLAHLPPGWKASK